VKKATFLLAPLLCLAQPSWRLRESLVIVEKPTIQ
jgi:hypothetical protein